MFIRTNVQRLFVASFALFSWVAGSAAQPTIRIVGVNVLDEQYRPYKVGTNLLVNVDDQKLGTIPNLSQVRARVIRASPHILRQLANAVPADDCIVLYSNLYRVSEHSGGLRFNITFTPEWLSVVGNQVREQTYILVLERANELGQFLRLRPNDLLRYLEHAYAFVVVPDTPLSSNVIRQIARRAIPPDRTPQAPCWRMQVTVHGGMPVLAMVECDAPDNPGYDMLSWGAVVTSHVAPFLSMMP